MYKLELLRVGFGGEEGVSNRCVLACIEVVVMIISAVDHRVSCGGVTVGGVSSCIGFQDVSGWVIHGRGDTAL